MTLWRHKVRGHVYEILTDTASIQCSAAPDIEAMFENEDWTVYRNVKTGAVWIRPTEEFLDGRFERVDGEDKIRAESAAEIDRLRAALKQAGLALEVAECVIDADDCVETFHAMQLARKVTKQALEQLAATEIPCAEGTSCFNLECARLGCALERSKAST